MCVCVRVCAYVHVCVLACRRTNVHLCFVDSVTHSKGRAFECYGEYSRISLEHCCWDRNAQEVKTEATEEEQNIQQISHKSDPFQVMNG